MVPKGRHLDRVKPVFQQENTERMNRTYRHHMGMAARLGCLATVLLAAGCAATPATWMVPYSINPTHAAAVTPIKPTGHKVLRLATVSTTQWLATQNYQYRLLYQDPQRLLVYRDARWVGTPAAMLQNQLQQQLQNSGQWRAVLSASSSGAASWVLQVHLNRFVVRFSTPTSGTAVIAGTATLLSNANSQVVAQQHFQYSAPLVQASAAGGAAAMAIATTHFVSAVRHWTAAVVQ